MTVEQLTEEVLSWPSEARALLADRLVESLDPVEDQQVREVWAAEAKRRRVPAFRILSDRVLIAVAAERPRDEEGLLAISGIGPTIVSKYGDALLRLVGGEGA